MLVIIFTITVLGVHFIVILGLGLWDVLPPVVEQPLQVDTRQIYGCTGWIEMEAVADHELEISEERLSIRALVMVQLLPHRQEVHGLLDDLQVRCRATRSVEGFLGKPFISRQKNYVMGTHR